MSKPRNKTIKAVIEYLAIEGLEIMAPNIDLETGQQRGGNRCLDAEQVIQYLKLDEVWCDPEDM